MHKVNQDTYARVFKLLVSGPASSKEIVDETGLHITTVQSLMRCFRKHKLVHVTAWETDSLGRDTYHVYKFGKGKDMSRRVLTNAERQQRSRDKRKSMQTLFRGQ